MDENWLKIVEYLLGCLSILGCLFIILVFFCYKSVRSFQFECVVNLTISSLLTTCSYLIYFVDIKDKSSSSSELDSKLCNFQAFLMLWFENAQYIWGFLIAWSTYQYVLYFEDNNYKTSFFKRLRYHLIGFGLPLIFALVALSRNVFGPSLAWCWIDATAIISDTKNLEKNVFSILSYLFMWILIIMNILLTFKVVRFLNRNYVTKYEREITGKYIWKLLRFIVIQIICVSPGTINRLLQIFFDTQVYELEILQLFMVVSQGSLFAIAYGYNSQVKKVLLGTCILYSCGCCLCNCLKSRRESVSSNSQRLYEGSHNQSDSNITLEE
jgi:hypothetical protein